MGVVPSPARLTSSQRVFVVSFPLVVGLLVPSLVVFLFQVDSRGKSFVGAIVEVLRMQFASGQQLLLVAMLGLMPFGLLTLLLHLYAARGYRRGCWAMLLAGLAGILILMLPVHLLIWAPSQPRSLPSPNVMFVFISSLFSVITLYLGLIIGQRMTGLAWCGDYPKGHCADCGYNLHGNVSGVCPECGSRATS